MTDKLIRLQASLEKAEAKAAKIESTIARHFKQLEKKVASLAARGEVIDYSGVKFGLKYKEFPAEIAFMETLINKYAGCEFDAYIPVWEMYDVKDKLDDINNSYKKLAEAQQIISNWEAKVAKEAKVAVKAEQAPQVIVDFLNEWEKVAVEWHLRNTKDVVEADLRKHIAQEKADKLVGLISRVEHLTGTITEGEGLTVSSKGDLVGTIIGEQGSAYLQTIMAGGYNIQCFHFRTLVHPV